MSSAHLLRLQIEAALSDRIPSALTPAPQVIRPTAPSGIPALDERLGLPTGAITELAGPESSGRTSLALSFLAGITQAARVCAWVDVSDMLDPESAAAIGVDLDRLLWVRCSREAAQAAPKQLVLPGFVDNAPHAAENQPSAAPKPTPAAAKQPSAVREDFAPRCAEPQPTIRRKSREVVVPSIREHPAASPLTVRTAPAAAKWLPAASKAPWSRLDQALRVTDLLLQAGGFSAIVLDMGSIAAEYALRVPLATWFRYRAAAERTQASVVLLTQQACSKSSAGLVLYLQPGQSSSDDFTVLTGIEHRVEIARERFTKVVDFTRKPPQSDHSVLWQSRTPWSGRNSYSSKSSGQK